MVTVPDISPSLLSQRPGEWSFLIPYPVKNRKRRSRRSGRAEGKRDPEGPTGATGPYAEEFMVEEEGKGPQRMSET